MLRIMCARHFFILDRCTFCTYHYYSRIVLKMVLTWVVHWSRLHTWPHMHIVHAHTPLCPTRLRWSSQRCLPLNVSRCSSPWSWLIYCYLEGIVCIYVVINMILRVKKINTMTNNIVLWFSKSSSVARQGFRCYSVSGFIVSIYSVGN